MRINKKRFTKNNDYLICILDILGFENLFNELGLEIIESKYKELIAVIEEQNISFAVVVGPGGYPMAGSPNIKSAYFSDSIIIWCKYDFFRMEVLFNTLKELLCKSIEIGLPLRGSISVGPVKIDEEKSIFLGQPIIAAARAESVQKWIGITFSKTFNEEPYCNGFKLDCFLQYDKHLKKGGEKMTIPLVIDFPRQWRLKRKNSLIDAIQKLNRDAKYSVYYTNTINFIKFSEEKHDWWKKDPRYLEGLEKMEKRNEKT